MQMLFTREFTLILYSQIKWIYGLKVIKFFWLWQKKIIYLVTTTVKSSTACLCGEKCCRSFTIFASGCENERVPLNLGFNFFGIAADKWLHGAPDEAAPEQSCCALNFWPEIPVFNNTSAIANELKSRERTLKQHSHFLVTIIDRDSSNSGAYESRTYQSQTYE